MEDKLVICSHCGSDACYEHKQQGITVLSCLSCGYITNELMTEGSQLVTETEEVMPELYKDIKFVDDQKRVWYPTVSPTFSPSMNAIRCAAALAASRRGSSITILRPATQSSCRRRSGTRVVLPAPGGAMRTE